MLLSMTMLICLSCAKTSLSLGPRRTNFSNRKSESLSHLRPIRQNSFREDQPPFLIPQGDMIGLEIYEDVPVGTVIYQLKGRDPEGTKLTYTISGDILSVQSQDGSVTLKDKLDHEVNDIIDVVITIQDEALNLIPYRRQIRVLDRNDNRPIFLKPELYRFSVSETTAVETTVFASIAVSDLDSGVNGAIRLICMVQKSPEACKAFTVTSRDLRSGSVIGIITLNEPLDYEKTTSYELFIEAIDQGSPSLSSEVALHVKVLDEQDQKPYFINAPYSNTVQENSLAGTPVFNVQVRDGDVGIPRQILLEIIDDSQQYFELDILGSDESGTLEAIVKTSSNIIDRENEIILSQGGGLYTFLLRAYEITEDGFYGDEVSTNVTIVVTDVDDQIPTFNHKSYIVTVPENIGYNTPLPGLNIIVSDGDVSRHAEYELSLEATGNSDGVFSVNPTKSSARTSVIIRVIEPDRLDFESNVGNHFNFRLNALQGGRVLSSVEITVNVSDANDNTPNFEKSHYEFSVPENAKDGYEIGTVVASDKDSGEFGSIKYSIKGFGSNKFSVNSESGKIAVSGPCNDGLRIEVVSNFCIDYESQSSYTLIYVAVDGGGETSTTSIIINVMDVNDNYPSFKMSQYKRVVAEGATEFLPPLFIEATDADGFQQGDGNVFYSINSVNTESTMFSIDPITGQISMLAPLKYSQSENGIFDLVVRATDDGKPHSLYSDVRVSISVGTDNNLKPIFEQDIYHAEVDEDANPGTIVLRVKATNAAGGNENLRYFLHSGAKDSFTLDEISGVLYTAKEAVLDIQENGDNYTIKILAKDGNLSNSYVGETVVYVTIVDINDKAPSFEKGSYTAYILENTSVGEEVLVVKAFDEDKDANLVFSIVEPIIARDKMGNMLKREAAYNFTSAFMIDDGSGKLAINKPLSYNSAAVIILTLQVEDINAAGNRQIATVDATFYIQAYRADAPQFSAPWIPSNPVINLRVKEGHPIGTIIYKLNANDPVTGQEINQYQKLPLSDPENLISISPLTGEIFNNQILDYETRKQISFQVRAIAGDLGHERSSEASVILELIDVNDNYPQFDQDEYSVSISESILPMAFIISVKATDVDTGSFGSIRYSIGGGRSQVFHINPEDGRIYVKAGANGRSNIDREISDVYTLQIVATDQPEGGPHQKYSSTKVTIRIMDVNDSPPEFANSQYTAVVPENTLLGTLVLSVRATDPDLGTGGEVKYEFVVDGPTSNYDLFKIDSRTGDIFTKILLTGKGRQAPYGLLVRASDGGEAEEDVLFTDTEVFITIGDVSSNDGIPKFVSPTSNEIAYIDENSKVGARVFQVKAVDPDDENSANGKIVYSLPDDGTVIRRLFQINPISGVITTKVRLDREERDNYTLILEAKDLGTPPQGTSVLLHLVVRDTDDHDPHFNRQKNSVPLEMEVEEELEIGSVIGSVHAVDEDIGDNAVINYAIIDGNIDGIFGIHVDNNNSNDGILTIRKRLDREATTGFYLLTIKCLKPRKNLKPQEKPYNKANLDEIQVKIVILDIDDNFPKFTETNISIGIRVNSPKYSELVVLKAVDKDQHSQKVQYIISNLTHVPSNRDETFVKTTFSEPPFLLDRDSGSLVTNMVFNKFYEGHFLIQVKASNSVSKYDIMTLKVYVLQDTALLKFVFDSPPARIQSKLSEFKNQIENDVLQAEPYKLNIYDIEFYSKVDGSLDFGRTSSCFQVLNDEFDKVLDFSSAEDLFDRNKSNKLDSIYEKYNVVDVERCSNPNVEQRIEWIHIGLLIIAALIGGATFISVITLSCIYNRHKHLVKQKLGVPVQIIETPIRTVVPTSLPPGSIYGSGNPNRNSETISAQNVLFDWQQHPASRSQLDAVSYRSLPRM